mgnify:FL=1
MFGTCCQTFIASVDFCLNLVCNRFIFFGGKMFRAPHHGKPFRDNERSIVYLYREPVDIKNLKLQESEVEEVIWMDFEECRRGIVDGTLPNCIYEGEFQMVGKALGIE